MTRDEILSLMEQVVAEVRRVLAGLENWELAGTEKASQYSHDLVADEAALKVLFAAGINVVSEESGIHTASAAPAAPSAEAAPSAPASPSAEWTVVIDPVDGSTNAAMGLPWYACSLAAVRNGVLEVALVENLATGQRFTARSGEGATVDGVALTASPRTTLDGSIVVLNGHASPRGAWAQYRSLGATALDLCFVGAGRFDGSVDAASDEIAPWDYLGAMLVCQEAGAVVQDLHGRPMVTLDPEARRTPITAGTPELLAELVAFRQGPDFG